VALDWGADPSALGGAGSPAPNPPLDELEAAVCAVQAGDPAALDAAGLADEVARLEVVSARLAARQVACVAVMEARGDASRLGFRSTQAWLRTVVRMAPGAAKGLVTLARRISCGVVGEHATAASFAAGRMLLAHARIVARTMAEIQPCLADPGEAAKLEEQLVGLAERIDPLRLASACRRLRIQAAPEQAAAEEWDAFAQRDLSVAKTFAGLGAIEGTMDPLGTETVMTAIHAFAAHAGADDTRTPGQRRADALTEICRRVLGFGAPPTNGGERPQVAVIVPLAELEERAGAEPGELAWTGPISAALLRRLLCDASVHRIITDPASQPLDVGRTTRVVPAGLRRAVMIRDRHCQYPGCDVPAVWCDCHHRQHWSRGGATSLHNLIMLCGYHHTQLHLSGHAIIRRLDGRIEIIPDPDHHRADNTDRGP
jgi:Domain of unknown function (DUF222)